DATKITCGEPGRRPDLGRHGLARGTARRQYPLVLPVKAPMPNQTVAAQPTPSPLRGPATMRRRRPSRFIRNIVTLVAILHVYVGLRLLPALPIGLAGRVLGALALCASFALIIVGARARM